MMKSSGSQPRSSSTPNSSCFPGLLTESQVRSTSKASTAGLCVGDEVVSINGTPCTDIPYSEVVALIEKSHDELQLLVKRTPSKMLTAENKNGKDENINKEEYKESTTLEIRPGPKLLPKEYEISETNCQSVYSRTECDMGLIGAEKDKPIMLCHKITPTEVETPKDDLKWDISLIGSKAEATQGSMVELQLTLPEDMHLGTGGAPIVSVTGADKSTSSVTEPSETGSGTSAFLNKRETPMQQASTTFQVTGKQQAQIIPVGEAKETSFPRVELILDCYGREKESRSLPDGGCVSSVEEGGQSVAPPSAVSFGIKAEDSEEGEEDQQAESDHTRPHKHRARHARLRRSESLSEKQVKEAKSKCKSIALLLTAAPNPKSKGVLMFKKRRQRARKFTLTSYGTGELDQQEDEEDEDDENKENTFKVTWYGTSESDLDEDFSSEPENETQIVTFDWDTGLVEVEKKLNSGETMEELPETKGKGVLMFARRKQRMDQISAEQEEIRKHSIEEKVSITENVNSTQSYQTEQQQTIKTQSCVSKSYIEVSSTRVQNGMVGAHESNSFQPVNRTAKPFSGTQNRAALPFSSGRTMASPISDVPAPPPYSSVTPPPDTRYQVSSPVPGKAQTAVWAPSYPIEQIASRDERIAVPASKTGILLEAKRRSTKPMFTFKEQPKVSPNPELLTLVQNREGKRGTGNESGPEEDYLSLGAEACNFMQVNTGKQKTPPPVAPKPSVKSPTTVMPISPVWAPPTAAPSSPQAFPSQNSFQSAVPADATVSQPNFHSYNPPSTLNLSGPFRAPPVPSSGVNQLPIHKTPPITPSGSSAVAGTAYEMPALKGKGAELFARRQSRMEKFVVDSTTVQEKEEKAARSMSPTPSLPTSWKYSSNVRAPPPLAYNPIQSPLYPPAANKPGTKTGSSSAKKKPTKALSALQVMKHQPYQLNASLFTFQAPSDTAPATGEAKKSTKSDFLPSQKQAQFTKQVNAPSNTNSQPTPEYSQPNYNTQPSFQSSVFTPGSECYSPVGYPMQPRQESPVATLIAPPRPKFSAKKAGVAAQESHDGRPTSFPARSFSSASSQQFGSPLSPRLFEPAPGYSGKSAATPEKPGKRITPWEAAAKSPMGFVDDMFMPQTIHESVSASVVSAARRKTLPEPPAAWKSSSNVPPTSRFHAYKGLYESKPSGISTVPKNVVSAPSMQCGYQLRYPYSSSLSITNAGSLPLDTRSEYCMSTGRNPNFNPYPRAWRS